MTSLIDRLCGIYECEPRLLLDYLWTEECIKSLRSWRYRFTPPAAGHGEMRYQGITFKSAERELADMSKKTTVAELYSSKLNRGLLHPYLPCMLEYLPETNTVNKIPFEFATIVE